MTVALLHAYSRANSGDGLLVDETIALLRDADLSVGCVISWDPDSFHDLDVPVVHPLTGSVGRHDLWSVARAAVVQRVHPSVQELLDESDLVVGVGGGYLRAGSVSQYLKSYVAHRTQLPTRHSRSEYIYLPQSIGPQPPRFLPSFAGRLKYAQEVFVRDDRSAHELFAAGLQPLRMPDLAVLRLAASGIDAGEAGDNGGRVGIVARDLKSRAPTYRADIAQLFARLDGLPLVQSEGAGNDDPAFYRSLGLGYEFEKLRLALRSSGAPAVVISVRLHGAIEALLAGVPTIHLSYERKGWGAFDDLGLIDYVHNARRFSVDSVLRQVEAIRADSEKYWNNVVTARKSLVEDRERLVAAMRAAAGRHRGGERK